MDEPSTQPSQEEEAVAAQRRKHASFERIREKLLAACGGGAVRGDEPVETEQRAEPPAPDD